MSTEKKNQDPLLERLLEKALYTSRWLLAPIYLGLAFAVIAVAIQFYMEVFHLLWNIQEVSGNNLILVVLGLVDLAMVGGLLIMVMLSGYENFVSKLDIEGADDMPNWLGKMDSGSLKLKIAASIVAISSIHLLQAFMEARNIPNDKLMWIVLIHITFVTSAFMMGVLEIFAKKQGARLS